MYDGGVVRPQVKQLFDPAVHDEEAAILSVLSHRNVVGYRCECSFESQRLLVTEFVPNGTVHEVLKFGKLSLTYALLLNWLSQIAEGMNYLHSGAPFTVSGFSSNASPGHGVRVPCMAGMKCIGREARRDWRGYRLCTAI